MSDPTHELAHVTVGLGKLAEQFKSKPRLTATLSAAFTQVQALEDAGWQLLTERGLSSAIGAQLDVLGRVVGEPRADSPDDTDYRTRLKARIRTNRSNGTPVDLLAIFAILLPGVVIGLLPNYPAGFVLTVNTPITAAYAALYARFVGAAKGAAINADVLWYPANDALMFWTESVCTFLTAPALMGGTLISIAVVSTAGFAASGTVILDQGSATGGDAVAFTVADGTHLQIDAGDLSFDYDANASVALLVPATVGLGFGDSTNPTTGGELAGVITA